MGYTDPSILSAKRLRKHDGRLQHRSPARPHRRCTRHNVETLGRFLVSQIMIDFQSAPSHFADHASPTLIPVSLSNNSRLAVFLPEPEINASISDSSGINGNLSMCL